MVFQFFLTNGKWYYSHHKTQRFRTIIVDQSGKGNFSSIQAAIDYVPKHNKNWVYINIKAGEYREKVVIPGDKPHIILKGEAKRKTKIVWDDHSTTDQSPTFTVLAHYTIALCITFVNSYNFPKSNNPEVPAVAAMIKGDKCVFYRCGFQGMQDTLWDNRGRHYFKRCTIQEVRGGGFITAQGRKSPSSTSGFVFKWCKVFGWGSAYLGRPWRDYARSNFTYVVNPKGWDPWETKGGKEDLVTFQEVENYGPGANTTQRVSWINRMSIHDTKELTSLSFIDQDNWVRQMPINLK
ncbi:hypothetical protein Tsubulata_019458 [Turnera subulata]|uniref:pectinesterase n=1 Tax=Turnera subulata TaxID=218843 RepID=A0A9Q0GLB1_9ROSI|nr:hypothetical protein Tsubulata_019458 [Turnera subulata]